MTVTCRGARSRPPWRSVWAVAAAACLLGGCMSVALPRRRVARPAAAAAPPVAAPPVAAPPLAAPPVAAPPERLTVAVPSDFPTLDPALANDTESVEAVQLLYEPLLTYAPPDGRLTGLLASGWAWSPGGHVLRVRLDPAARFADGRPVLASDVVFSFERLLSPAIRAPHAASFAALQGYRAYRSGAARHLAGVRAAGPHTVVFTLQTPQAFFLQLLALPSAAVVDAAAVRRAGAAGSGWWARHSYGSGPYVLSRWVRGQQLDLAVNPDYWRAGADLGGGVREGPFLPVVFQVVPSPARQVQLFRQGRVDLVWPLDAAQLDAARAAGLAGRVRVAPALSLSYLGFVVSRPPLDEVRVRQAIAMAIDQAALIRAAGGLGRPAASVLPPGMPGYDPGVAPIVYDPAAAHRMLREDGVLGRRLSLAVVAGPDVAVADAVRAELDAVGLSVQVRPLAWTAFYRVLAARGADLFQSSWLADYPDPQDFVFNLWNRPANPFAYRNPALQALESDADSQLDPVQRLAVYGQIQTMLRADMPAVPEFYGANAALVQRWLRPASAGLILSPVLAPQLDKLWVQRPPPAAGGAAPTAPGT